MLIWNQTLNEFTYCINNIKSVEFIYKNLKLKGGWFMPVLPIIELKAIVVGSGVDHESVKASIYLDNKKVGELLDDGWCDEIYLEFKNLKCQERFNNSVKRYYRKRKAKIQTPECFIRELLTAKGYYKGERSSRLPGCYQLCFIDKVKNKYK